MVKSKFRVCVGENIAPYPIIYEDERWLTTEALFQALRFDDLEVRSLIRSEKSPISAKMSAKKYADKMAVVPLSDADLDNMRLCLRLKIEQRLELREQLIASGNE